MALIIESLTKSYRKDAPPVLDDLSLEIRRGTFGLLGPNGAGKTTLIKILATQMDPTVGTVQLNGLDLAADRVEVRRRLGYLPQHFGAYPQLTAWEFLDYRARLGGLHGRKQREQRVEKSLEEVALLDVRNRRTGTFSGGMIRRLGIAQAILNDPEFLIVDEPTVGLDPEERIRFRSILGRLSHDRVILISTHIVGDISSTCEEIGVLVEGRLRFLGPPEHLVSTAEGKVWEVRIQDRDFEALSERFQVVHVSTDNDEMGVRIVGDDDPPEGAVAEAPNLEDAYVYGMISGVSLGSPS